MQTLIVAVLQTLGVGKIMTASSGQKGFERFCIEKPDIVLSDWHMKPVSGMDLLEMIRTHPDSPNKMTPVIMITGYSAIKRIITARDLGATEFLVKPFSAGDLARRIAHVISRPRDFVETGDYFGPDRRRKKIDAYQGVMRRKDDGSSTQS